MSSATVMRPIARWCQLVLVVALVVTSMLPSHTAAETLTSPIPPPEVTAKAVYVMDATTGIPLYSLNPDDHLAIGSVVKIMTALVVIEQVKDLNEQVTIVESDTVEWTEYSNMQLQAGDTLTVSLLLYGLMLPSGNDAALALARHVGGKIAGTTNENVAREAFVNEMNAYAARIGLDNSRFTVPDGVDTASAYSSAEDVAVMSRVFMQSDLLMGIVREPAYQFYSVGPENRQYTESTTNKLLGQDGIIGGKTGTTGAAGGNVVLFREVNNGTNNVIIVVIGAEHSFTETDETTGTNIDKRWDDARAIISAMDTQFTWTAPTADGVLPGLNEQLSVWDVEMQNPPAIPVPNGTDVNIGYQLQIGSPAAPGEQTGALHLFYGDTEVGSLPLYQAAPAAWYDTAKAA